MPSPEISRRAFNAGLAGLGLRLLFSPSVLADTSTSTQVTQPKIDLPPMKDLQAKFMKDVVPQDELAKRGIHMWFPQPYKDYIKGAGPNDPEIIITERFLRRHSGIESIIQDRNSALHIVLTDGASLDPVTFSPYLQDNLPNFAALSESLSSLASISDKRRVAYWQGVEFNALRDLVNQDAGILSPQQYEAKDKLIHTEFDDDINLLINRITSDLSINDQRGVCLVNVGFPPDKPQNISHNYIVIAYNSFNPLDQSQALMALQNIPYNDPAQRYSAEYPFPTSYYNCLPNTWKHESNHTFGWKRGDPASFAPHPEPDLIEYRYMQEEVISRAAKGDFSGFDVGIKTARAGLVVS